MSETLLISAISLVLLDIIGFGTQLARDIEQRNKKLKSNPESADRFQSKRPH